ncbi:glycoside hydrolase [Luteipulveratus mongoliensis]|uniref:Glycoside hydrolase n=1 Tax=Luteipulveratus mongoliensis TaxID=571913 RepID=A0A0K1JRF9_9MICO|nr:glycoside hydrolase [Luteipulveratus mongoliensis]
MVVVPYAVTNVSYTGTAYLPEPTDVGALTHFSAKDGVASFAAGTAQGKAAFTAQDQLRLQFAPDGKFTEPTGTKIVRTTPQPLKATRSWDAGTYYALASKQAVLRIYKSPLRFGLYKADNRTVIWEESKGLRWTQGGLRQSLKRGATEQFFGGGEQNGSFSHRDKKINVANSFDWNEGGYNNSQPFYLSTAGYGAFRNTFAPGLYNFGDPVRTGAREKRLDAYYFIGDAKKVIGDYTALVGKPFMPPIYGLESGDSDCYLHNANRGERHTLDALKVAENFNTHQMPNGWMLVNDGYGCGYENLPQTGTGLLKTNMQLGLWTQNGLPNQADEVKAGVRVRKLDVAWVGNGYDFALDACQQAKSGIEDNSDARGFVWLPNSWAGIQRCGVLWSGDQKLSWDYVRWQIPTYAGSTMSGIAYNTGDVGAIFGSDPKMHTRDLQWKSMTPTIMTMDGWASDAAGKPIDKQPWVFGEPYTSINRKYLQLKERLIPFMYSLSAQAARTGVGAIRPLALEYPNDPVTATDAVKQEFLVGQDFLVAPVSSDTSVRDGIYLPKGTWVDYWSGKTFQGPTTINGYKAPLDTLPMFVRAGAVVPMWPQGTLSYKTRDTSTLDYDIYARGRSSFTVYEDDGVTRQFAAGKSATQQVEVTAAGQGAGATVIKVGASTGTYAGKPVSRSYGLTVHVGAKPKVVVVDGRPLAAGAWTYDAAKKVVRLSTPKVSTAKAFTVVLAGAGGIT